MKNLLKNLFTKDMLIIIIINILIDLSYIPLFFLIFVTSLSGMDKEPNSLDELLTLISAPSLFIILRAMILPILYHFMEKKSKNQFVQNFIFKLRNSTKFKFKLLGYIALIHITIVYSLLIIVLPICIYDIIVDLFTPNTQWKSLTDLFDGILGFTKYCAYDLLICIFAGLIFNYLALYLYWFIVDKIKKRKKI